MDVFSYLEHHDSDNLNKYDRTDTEYFGGTYHRWKGPAPLPDVNYVDALRESGDSSSTADQGSGKEKPEGTGVGLLGTISRLWGGIGKSEVSEKQPPYQTHAQNKRSKSDGSIQIAVHHRQYAKGGREHIQTQALVPVLVRASPPIEPSPLKSFLKLPFSLPQIPLPSILAPSATPPPTLSGEALFIAIHYFTIFSRHAHSLERQLRQKSDLTRTPNKSTEKYKREAGRLIRGISDCATSSLFEYLVMLKREPGMKIEFDKVELKRYIDEMGDEEEQVERLVRGLRLVLVEWARNLDGGYAAPGMWVED